MRILKFVAIAAIAVGLTACGGKKSSDADSEPVVEQTEIEEAEEPEEEIILVEEEPEEEPEEAAPVSQSSSSSQDWDALLDSYEEYVNKYIEFYKKAQNGDMSAMTEYASMMQKAQDYANKLENARGEISAAQLARFQKIQAKMLEAVQNMR